jgi:hypothetical protein
MLDFKELPDDGTLFEQLIREMLIRLGFDVHWTGVGPDGGRDLVATERAKGALAEFSRKWLVSCKHKAHSRASVVMDDIRDIGDSCRAIGAEGYLLACSTQPASSVVKRLEELNKAGGLLTVFWDGIELEKRLNVPDLFPLIHQFFPKSSKAQPWKIFATDSPSVWAAYYKDYFVYLSSRIANAFPELEEVECIARKIEEIPLPGHDHEKHYLRLRAVYFDDKHEQFSVFADYLFPRDHAKECLSPEEINRYLKHGWGLHSDETGMWYLTHWDIRYVETSPYSDRFHLDSRIYYEPYLKKFSIGLCREGWLDDIDGPEDEIPTFRV